MTRLRRGCAIALVAAAALVGCNLVLGIQEQPLRAVAEDAGSDADEGGRPVVESCTRDQDCVAPNACYTPHCDPILGACTYALCEARDRTCAMGVCDTCQGETNGFTYARLVGSRMMLLCKRCDGAP